MENKYRDLQDLPMTLRVEELMPILGIGRNTAYELIRSGQIRSIRIGRQIRIPRDKVSNSSETVQQNETIALEVKTAQDHFRDLTKMI